MDQMGFTVQSNATSAVVWGDNTSTATITWPYNPYQGGSCTTYDLSKLTWPAAGTQPKGIDMKGNGKEFLVFAKGATAPVKACETEAEALEEASALADKNDETYFIYKAVKRVSPVRTDLEVTDL